ncbi:hypothetical protein IY145_21275 [Methylosinus sp. H3A]|uniref:hypothetical protein n=1 Tax=Methylosinus sp. H3A TaxID=2785786 RepID=UPI0018C21161|nr:hypothetical protein [Methylosinus sp. H3A]MBG0811883.1 hypothetical protein [Methylosinus sp. H3A]
MQRHSFIALLVVVAVSFSLATRLWRFALASFHDPKWSPALSADSPVHFEPAAEGCALVVGRMLPEAMRSVEDAHGRPFARTPIIGVYASYDNYAKANGMGDPGIAAVALSERIVLSPTLCGAERARLAPVLTHELSHAHLLGWRGMWAARPPSWFVEGLAVMVSGGAGAEEMSEEEARAQIREGHALIMAEHGVWADFSAIGFSKEKIGDFSKYDLAYRQRLAFRQAAMFVAWLKARDAARFTDILRRLEAGEAFPAAFEAAFGADLPTLSRRYLADMRK